LSIKTKVMKKLIAPLLLLISNLVFAQAAVEPTMSMIDSINVAFNNHDLQTYLSYFSDDAVFYNSADDKVITKGKKAIENLYNTGFYLIPDFRVTVSNTYVSGNTVVEEFMFSGTVNVVPPGYPESIKGKTFNTKACSVATFENGKIQSIKTYYDYLTMLNQLGWVNIVPGH